MNRVFTPREKVLLLILVILLLSAGYYWVVALPVQERITAAKASEMMAQDEIMVETLKAAQLKEMKAALEEARNSNAKQVSSIPDYDNLENIMVQLDAILTPALNYSLNFSDIIAEDRLTKRSISMTYTCGNYETAREIIDSFYNCIYRCTLDDITISAVTGEREGTPDLNLDGVSVSLIVTFYEKN